MFSLNQPESNRPQFVIEQLDARRLLSVSIDAEEPAVDESTEVIEVTLDVTVEEAVILDDVLMYKGGDEELVDPSIFEAEILTFEEPIENLEDVPPAEGEEDFIRYTMVPAENQRNLDGEDAGTEIAYTCGFGELEAEVLVIEEDPGYVAGEEIYYMTPLSQEPVAEASSDLPPPPAQAAGAALGRGLFDSVIDSSDDDVLS